MSEMIVVSRYPAGFGPALEAFKELQRLEVGAVFAAIRWNSVLRECLGTPDRADADASG